MSGKHRRVRLLTICLAMLALHACSTERIAMDPGTLKELTPQSRIIIVHYYPEPFSIWRGEQTARGVGLGLFGALGGAIEGGMQAADAKEAGAKFISQSQLTDPVARVQSRFLDAWQRETGVRQLTDSQLVNDDDVEVLQKKYGTGHVLDFRTLGWMIQPINHTNISSDRTYRAVYSARSRLVRLIDKTVVWQGSCEYGKDSVLTPTLNFLDVAGNDNGVAAKAALNTLADHCADSLWRQFFGRDAGPDIPSPPSHEQQANK